MSEETVPLAEITAEIPEEPIHFDVKTSTRLIEIGLQTVLAQEVNFFNQIEKSKVLVTFDEYGDVEKIYDVSTPERERSAFRKFTESGPASWAEDYFAVACYDSEQEELVRRAFDEKDDGALVELFKLWRGEEGMDWEICDVE